METMKQLPGDRSTVDFPYAQVKFILSRPILTHAIPGIAIGGLLVLLFAHIINVVLGSAQVLIGLLVLIPSLYVYLHGTLKKDDEIISYAGISGGIALAWLGMFFVFSWLSSCSPGIQDRDCSKHGNSYTMQILNLNATSPIKSIVCKDGFTP